MSIQFVQIAWQRRTEFSNTSIQLLLLCCRANRFLCNELNVLQLAQKKSFGLETGIRCNFDGIQQGRINLTKLVLKTWWLNNNCSVVWLINIGDGGEGDGEA